MQETIQPGALVVLYASDTEPPSAVLSLAADEPDGGRVVIESTMSLAEYTRFVANARQLLADLHWDHARWVYATEANSKLHLMPRHLVQEFKAAGYWHSIARPLCGKPHAPQTDGWLVRPLLNDPDKIQTCASCYRLWQGYREQK